MTEHEIQKEILNYLEILGIFHWRNNTGRRGKVSYGYIGSPDIIGILHDGKFIGIEVKTETGKQSDKQIEFQENIEMNNGIYILARSVDDVKKRIADKR